MSVGVSDRFVQGSLQGRIIVIIAVDLSAPHCEQMVVSTSRTADREKRQLRRS